VRGEDAARRPHRRGCWRARWYGVVIVEREQLGIEQREQLRQRLRVEQWEWLGLQQWRLLGSRMHPGHVAVVRLVWNADVQRELHMGSLFVPNGAGVLARRQAVFGQRRADV
jgi:hypothetical protein